ncbi:hypothetical protein A1O3_09261 [Capronia epimyces CBS 606.96]|uniref:Uncharacterized protein n=1 Tax=Capronia epimyces CBS 606.96 TaxID=1182542 RepID=W9XL98_9EURO|nr:uncharacterized protein A1O3_09261 [Capronia epimyces CBS 606.96]EXJ78100.1 hypothetical protein A1O3_09261 [Capronia epimyces CBS 606.96]
MDEHSTGDVVKELHRDLVVKYNRHAAAVERYWRSFDQSQRTKCIKAGAADGVVLKHPLDRALGDVYKIIPEINLRDITSPESDFLLDLLKHRATNSLLDQYMTGLNGGPGDHAFIKNMMDTRNLALANPDRNILTLFFFLARIVLARLAPSIRANLCVSQELGELILQRQTHLLQSLNIVIEDILDIGSKIRDRKKPPKRSDKDKAAVAAISKLSIQTPPTSLLLSDLINGAVEQKSSNEEYLNLLSTEPVDEKGRSLPVHTDKYISGAVLEAAYRAVKAAAIWNYISGLLKRLESTPATDKIYKTMILQEISNVCQMEYSRTQALFKQNVQIATGVKWFKRMSNAYDKAGNARVNMKGDPGALTRTDPQLHYMLRLCQSETTASKATDWMKKLGDLHDTHPSEREKLEEREVVSLGDLAITTAFIQDLSAVVSMPPPSRKKAQMFVARSQELDAEMNELKSQIDLQDFAVPIDNLLEPRVAAKMLRVLDDFIIEKAGTQMGFLFQDLIEECFTNLENQYKDAKDKAEQKEKAEETPLPSAAAESPEKRVEQRRQKEKTRPSHSSAYQIIAPGEEEKPVQGEEAPPLPPTIKVRASTADVFSMLFSNAEARGSVNWTAFTAAMADVGFSVKPNFGSVYTFYPPESLKASKAVTFIAHTNLPSRAGVSSCTQRNCEEGMAGARRRSRWLRKDREV